MTRFIDANVIVKAFFNNPDKDSCRHFLQEEFVTNMLCLVEAQKVLSVIKKDRIYAAECVKSLLKGSGIIAQLDKNLLFESLKRTEKYNLDPFDLIHYATALLNNCHEIVSYDKDFNDLEIKRTEP